MVIVHDIIIHTCHQKVNRRLSFCVLLCTKCIIVIFKSFAYREVGPENQKWNKRLAHHQDEVHLIGVPSHPRQFLFHDAPSRVHIRYSMQFCLTIKGYTFGALRPNDGEVFTETYSSRSAKNFVDFLEKVEQWLPVYLQVNAVFDNLSAHRAIDILLLNLRHLYWQFVFQPKYADYLNLIEPW